MNKAHNEMFNFAPRNKGLSKYVILCNILTCLLYFSLSIDLLDTEADAVYSFGTQ